MQHGAEMLEISESAATSDSDLQWPWDPQSRWYLADMHETEVWLPPSHLYPSTDGRAFILHLPVVMPCCWGRGV